jgi:hypothetical protein
MKIPIKIIVPMESTNFMLIVTIPKTFFWPENTAKYGKPHKQKLSTICRVIFIPKLLRVDANAGDYNNKHLSFPHFGALFFLLLNWPSSALWQDAQASGRCSHKHGWTVLSGSTQRLAIPA